MSNKNSNPLECSSGRAQKRSLYVKGCQRPKHWQSEKYTKKNEYLSKWAKRKKRRKEKISKGEFFGNKNNRNNESFKGQKK